MSKRIGGASRAALSLLLTTLVLTLTGGLGASASAADHTDALRVSVGTHNTHRGAGSFTDLADIVGWQEVKPWAHGKLKRSLPGYTHFTPRRGGSATDSISWRTGKFERIDSGVDRTHAGVRRLTPSRYVTWVVLRHRATGQRVTFANTHFINGAFKSHKSRHKFRARKWHRHAHVLRDVMRDLRKKGYPMFLVGDFNSRTTMRLPGVERALPQGRLSIDQIYVPRTHTLRTPNGSAAKVATQAQRLGHRGSDHPAFRAELYLPATG